MKNNKTSNSSNSDVLNSNALNNNVLLVDNTLSFLKNTPNDPYLLWLTTTDFIPKSYLEHPLRCESDLTYYKNYFKRNFKLSLGGFIRTKRVFFILNNTNADAQNILSYTFITTPIGLMVGIFSDKGLCLLEFLDRKMLESEINELIKTFNAKFILKDNDFCCELQNQITQYFKKQRTKFSIALDMVGTDFQKQVWQELTKIEYGQTIAYSKQAQNLSMPNATRAVASANGKNKISIIVPCHRVVQKDGGIGGYGGGVDRKKFLIELERTSS